MKIYIASDHAGFYLKKELIKYLGIKGYDVEDVGAFEMDEEDDYPDFIIPCVKKVVDDTESLGIVIGGSGNGEAIAANKIKGIRAALAEHIKDAYLARKDDDCNVLCLQGRGTNFNKAQKIVQTFLETNFSTISRYKRRINKIKKLEGKK